MEIWRRNGGSNESDCECGEIDIKKSFKVKKNDGRRSMKKRNMIMKEYVYMVMWFMVVKIMIILKMELREKG